ncbi:protease SohB [Glaciecola sp. KUL10]|uniref:protease SohB n=1 Tax=Glaciecola sp. (strain KUL10) TaxID=2161813 RepID=UPI000D78C97E|nr:protease SohB [Glaciecola sp. KUL10]GBL05374.1 periplasmic protease [Glaciecola sp. KUL10]
MEFLFEYGVFLAKAITIVVAIVAVVAFIVGLSSKQKQPAGNLEFDSISDHIDDLKLQAKQVLLTKDELKQLEKEEKEAKKKEKKEKKKKTKDDTSADASKKDKKPNLFVLEFNGSMQANEVEQLREEITAVLCVAEKDDEVLVKVESGGGVVHGYGLAASQLQRIKEKGLKLTISVDKVAASGGYMMACVADELIAAPFAIIGSIGVIAQLPNFNKLLKKNDIEFEQHTAGAFKRTLTILGENTDEGREKFKEELEDVHVLFKDFVSANRNLDINKVATGEYWYGQRALELDLVDKLQTSDDYLMNANDQFKLFKIKYAQKKTLAQKLGFAASIAMQSTLERFIELGNRSYR